MCYMRVQSRMHTKTCAHAFAVIVPINIDSSEFASWLTRFARFKMGWAEHAELACGATRVETCLVAGTRRQTHTLALSF